MHHHKIGRKTEYKNDARDTVDQVALAKKLEGQQSATSQIAELHEDPKKVVKYTKNAHKK